MKCSFLRYFSHRKYGFLQEFHAHRLSLKSAFLSGFSGPIEILPRNLDNPKTAISLKKEHLVPQQWRHSSKYLFSHKASSNSAYAMDPYFWWLFAYRPSIFPHTLILCEHYESSHFWVKMYEIPIIMTVIRS